MTKPNLSVIDADSCSYSLVWKYQDVSTQQMQAHVNQWVESILAATQADYYLGFVGGVGNFRKEVAVTKPYKGQRKEDPESVRYWKPIIKGHLLDHWGFTQVDGQEADDACSVARNKYCGEFEVTIAHCDWDLDQLPGKHFNFQKGEYYTLTPFQASYNFHHQLLTGCSGDEVPGLPKWGPVKATKLLAGSDNLADCVYGAYLLHSCEDYYQEQYTLLKLLEEEKYGFTCPTPLPVPSSPIPQLEQAGDISHLFN